MVNQFEFRAPPERGPVEARRFAAVSPATHFRFRAPPERGPVEAYVVGLNLTNNI